MPRISTLFAYSLLVMAQAIFLLAPTSSAWSSDKEAAHHSYLAKAASTLVTADGKTADVARITKHKYTLIYFSAHWCGPCRAFTPDLVKYYKEKGGGEKFEILFVSSDRDAASFAGYMKEVGMPWVGLSYGADSTKELKSKFGGRGIPCLTVVDENDNVVYHSYVDGKYVGPRQVLSQFTELMAKG